MQDHAEMNISAPSGVAVREFPLKRSHGFADYLLYADGKALGVIEAKPEGWTLRDESLEDSANLPEPDVIAEEIADDLQAALEQFATIAADLKER